MPFFSVIIPVYNRAHLIGKALHSVFIQEFTDYEVIVVDDGSTDNTLDILQQYRDRIRIVTQKNQGPGAARNSGINAAQGQYITFLDSDDLWFPWTLATYKHVIDQYQSPAFIAGAEISFQNDSECQSITPNHMLVAHYPDYYASAEKRFWIGTCGTAIQTQKLREVGGFCLQSINNEDTHLWQKLGAVPGFAYIHSPYVFGYRRHPHSVSAHIDKTLQGILFLIKQEHHGVFPGGRSRQYARLTILSRHTRSQSVGFLNHGWIKAAWRIYANTFWWNLQLKNLRYLLAFPLVSAWALVRRKTKTP